MTITLEINASAAPSVLDAFAAGLPPEAPSEDRIAAFCASVSTYVVDVVHGHLIETAVSAARSDAEASFVTAQIAESISVLE